MNQLRWAVRDTSSGIVTGIVSYAVCDVVRCAVDDVVSNVVHKAQLCVVGDAVYGAVRGSVDNAVDDVLSTNPYRDEPVRAEAIDLLRSMGRDS